MATITFDNQDDGVSHDIEFFSPDGSLIAASDIIVGPSTAVVTFTPGVPGTYAFKCSVHPRDMTGALKAE